jgi:RHS repeat-associated protein
MGCLKLDYYEDLQVHAWQSEASGEADQSRQFWKSIVDIEYVPFGEVFLEEKNAKWNTPYLFTSMELDKETGWNYFGARYQDPKLGIFLSVDLLAEKYPSWSSYAYCYNNPVNVIDPDGKEGIVLSGQPGTHNNREHFLVNGLNRAKGALNHRHSKSEKVTWVVYNDKSKEYGYTKEMLAKYQKLANKAGVTMKVVSNIDDVIDYVNNKTCGSSRENDKITSFYYVGHAKPSNLNPGYPEDKGALDPSDFSSDAFPSGAWINVVGGCRTDVDKSWIFDDSVVDKLQSKVDGKSTVNGSSVRVQYDGGVVSDEQLVKPNNGKIVTVKGKKDD